MRFCVAISLLVLGTGGAACTSMDAGGPARDESKSAGKADGLGDGGAATAVTIKEPNVYVGNWFTAGAYQNFEGQGWTFNEMAEFLHTWIGPRLMPVDWFRALRTADGRTLVDPSLLSEYGFTVTKSPSGDWPRGFFTNFNAGFDSQGASVGHTCGACHVSTINYNGTTLTVVGTAGRQDFSGYVRRIYQELEDTLNDPVRWDAFDAEVNPKEFYYAVALNIFVRRYLYGADAFRGAGGFEHLHPVADGPGRADATGHLGLAFSMQRASGTYGLKPPPEGVPAAAAPVSIPALWGTASHDYTHYTGAFRSPLVRDLMNAAGWDTEYHPPYDFNVDFPLLPYADNADAVEKLESPAWPEAVFGAIDVPLATEGRAIYQAQCASCHEGTWSGDELKLSYVDVDEVGTDPAAADYVMNARIDASWIAPQFVNASPLDVAAYVGERMFEDSAAAVGITANQREIYTRGRPFETRRVRAYKARPLDGIWATAPYLHNGSVATLDDLLRPPAQRAVNFWVSPDAEYDPVHVGFESVSGVGFLFDTTIPGNSNAGHTYGTALDTADREALIE
ncbi:MAG: hypothetical protein KC417_03240, partial [Myxococcales bacterium]|nr:hypothetical protein [Myxococcales bacterium]